MQQARASDHPVVFVENRQHQPVLPEIYLPVPKLSRSGIFGCHELGERDRTDETTMFTKWSASEDVKNPRKRTIVLPFHSSVSVKKINCYKNH
ncbi:hypothetical protein GWI33_001662 [Rhynchophorus ferrugineus]|uniref:Uncharacterized protein n=1 Tax=Rhynchophorus ferrugineus TaxID=354439 RepID=A0A834MLQ3_RHYFE|nr:hypothetical protein GWI33_001662 [Rhynchophorus ferrugineus]